MANEKKALLRFDVYDIFGYLIPGVILLVGIYVHMKVFDVKCLQDPLSKVFLPCNSIDNNPGQNTSNFPIFSSPLFWRLMTAFLFFAYIIGHLVASFGAVILDKWVSERVLGFPFKRLFKNVLPLSDYDKRKTCFHKALLVNFLVMLIVLAILGPSNRYFLFLLSFFVLLALIKIGFTWFSLEDIQAPSSERPGSNWRHKVVDWLWKWMIRWWLRPLGLIFFDSWANLLLTMFRMRKPFSKVFQEKFSAHFYKAFDLDLKKENLETEIFWLPYCYVSEKAPASARLMHHWLCLQGFARNLAVSFFLLFVYGIAMDKFCPSGMYHAEKYEYLCWCFITGISAVLLGLRYYYLYYNYFSKFVFRAFFSVVCSQIGGYGDRRP